MELMFSLENNRYPIIIGEKILASFNPSLYFKGKKIVILSHHKIWELHGSALLSALKDYQVHTIFVPQGEDSKSLECCAKVYSELTRHGIGRSDLFIAFGGGVIGDLGGFIASSYLRGISFIQIPTTLLAQIDSSMGGKVGINLPEGKNLVGAFYHPKAVISDTSLLKTLDPSDFQDGLSEMIKYGMIWDKTIIDCLDSCQSLEDVFLHLDKLIPACCTIKKNLVEEDEKDLGIRMTLNFGHTLGHAIEKKAGISHGQAVALGMVQITDIAVQKELVQEDVLYKITMLLKRFSLPYDPTPYPLSVLLPYVLQDKKNIFGNLNLILVPKIGESIIYPTDIHFFEEI